MWKKQGDLSDLGILQVLAMPISFKRVAFVASCEGDFAKESLFLLLAIK